MCVLTDLLKNNFGTVCTPFLLEAFTCCLSGFRLLNYSHIFKLGMQVAIRNFFFEKIFFLLLFGKKMRGKVVMLKNYCSGRRP